MKVGLFYEISVPLNPISATFCTADTDLPRIRFAMDPEVPVVRGTRRIRESREDT